MSARHDNLTLQSVDAGERKPAFWQVLVRSVATGCCAALAMFCWERGMTLGAALAAATAIGLIADYHASNRSARGAS